MSLRDRHSKARFIDALWWWVGVAACGALVSAVAVVVPFGWWRADLARHPLPHATALSLALLLLAIWRGRAAVALLCLPTVGIGGYFIAPYVLPVIGDANARDRSAPGETAPSDLGDRNPIRVIVANVLTRNERREDVVRALRTEKPDVAVFLEVDGEWAAALKTLADIMPYEHDRPQRDNFGLMVMSAFPMEHTEVVKLEDRFPPYISTDLRIGARTIHLVAVHTLPPQGRELTEIRNGELEILAERFGHSPVPTILAGDLNATPWSLAFRTFLGKTEFRDARRGIGILPTWPSGLRDAGIPIDHVLLLGGFSVQNGSVFAIPGSDHRGARFEISLPPAPS